MFRIRVHGELTMNTYPEHTPYPMRRGYALGVLRPLKKCVRKGVLFGSSRFIAHLIIHTFLEALSRLQTRYDLK
jgi:hypothetical protein